MKTNKNFRKIYGLILFSVIAISCNTKNEKQLNVEAINNKNGKPTLSYVPDIQFETLHDSVPFFLTTNEIVQAVSNNYLKGDVIKKTNRYTLRSFLKMNEGLERNSHEIFLRTYDKKFKIIGSLVLGSNYGTTRCSGSYNGSDNIKIMCNNKEQEFYTINKKGEFIKK